MWEYLFLLQMQYVTTLVLFKHVDQWPSGMAPDPRLLGNWEERGPSAGA